MSEPKVLVPGKDASFGHSLLGKFCTRLAAVRRCSPTTVATYKLELRFFLEHLDENGLGIPTVTLDDLVGYLFRRQDSDHLNSRSVAKAVSCLRSFFRFVVEEGVRLDNPATLLERPGICRRLPETMELEAVEKLLDTIDTGSALGLRDRALFEMIYSSGLRISEAVGLNVRDLDFNEGIAKVRGKGGKERLALFGPAA